MPDMSRYYITELTAEQYEEDTHVEPRWRIIRSYFLHDLCKPIPLRRMGYDNFVFWAESWADAKAAMAQESGGS